VAPTDGDRGLAISTCRQHESAAAALLASRFLDRRLRSDAIAEAV
jgi:hypothetical protein